MDAGKKIAISEANDEVIGLWGELQGRGQSNGAVWVVLQTLLMLLDLKVINGPAWESGVNIASLLYPGSVLLVKYVCRRTRL